MISFHWYRSGDLFGIRYDFEFHGEEIPWHTHKRELYHNVICLEGWVRVDVKDEKSTTSTYLQRGKVLDFENAKPHRVVAMCGRSSVLHMFLHGMPEGYSTLPESEHEGVLHV